MTTEPRVVILGGGPAGVGGAYRLRAEDKARVTVVEQRESVGGNAGSFTVEGQRVDYGSHRLHPSCHPAVMEDIRCFLGDDLRRRPRHGRIRLLGRWIHFPLRFSELLTRLDPSFAAGMALDAVPRLFLPTTDRGETFASVLEAGLGPTICHNFYFPYARKIWGREPDELSRVQAERRVAANSFSKLFLKVLGRLPGVESPGFDHFYYPRGGYGRISESYAEAADREGADFLLGWRAEGLERENGAWMVTVERDEGERRTLRADHVWSTIPIPVLARLHPSPPEDVVRSARRISYRSMILVYLVVPAQRFSEYDAHYFPGEEVSITRISEPKNYAGVREPVGRTVLCAELPCSRGGEEWNESDTELARRVREDLRNADIPLPEPPSAVRTVRLPNAYPIYLRGFSEHFDRLDRWAGELPGILTYGRQGLFAHDNTHHALRMAYCAADCLRSGGFDEERWADYREEFEEHVVED